MAQTIRGFHDLTLDFAVTKVDVQLEESAFPLNFCRPLQRIRWSCVTNSWVACARDVELEQDSEARARDLRERRFGYPHYGRDAVEPRCHVVAPRRGLCIRVAKSSPSNCGQVSGVAPEADWPRRSPCNAPRVADTAIRIPGEPSQRDRARAIGRRAGSGRAAHTRIRASRRRSPSRSWC